MSIRRLPDPAIAGDLALSTAISRLPDPAIVGDLASHVHVLIILIRHSQAIDGYLMSWTLLVDTPEGGGATYDWPWVAFSQSRGTQRMLILPVSLKKVAAEQTLRKGIKTPRRGGSDAPLALKTTHTSCASYKQFR